MGRGSASSFTRFARKLLAPVGGVLRSYFASLTRFAFTKAPCDRTSSRSSAASLSLRSCSAPAAWTGPVRLTLSPFVGRKRDASFCAGATPELAAKLDIQCLQGDPVTAAETLSRRLVTA